MFTTPKEVSNLLPVKIASTDLDLEKFLEHACQSYLPSPGFIDAEQVRSAVARADAMLESIGLTAELRHGAVLTHVERGGGTSDLVRPAVHLQLRRDRNQWWLRKFSIGLVYPFEPTATGITLTWRQRAYCLWTCSPSLQVPWGRI